MFKSKFALVHVDPFDRTTQCELVSLLGLILSDNFNSSLTETYPLYALLKEFTVTAFVKIGFRITILIYCTNETH